MILKIDQEKLLWWLIPGIVTAEIAIVMLDALVSELGWVQIGAARRLFNITREDGIQNFFSSFQMLTVGAVLLLITLVVWSQNQGSRPKLASGWGLITALFFYMGADDAITGSPGLGRTRRPVPTGGNTMLGDAGSFTHYAGSPCP